MKILMINTVCGFGSTGRICTDLAEILERQGHQVKIAYGRGVVPHQYQKYAVRIGSELDVKLHALKARIFDCAGFGSRRVTKAFIQWIKDYDPDIIHLHNLHGYYLNVEVLFNYLATCKKKIFWTLHDCWAFTGHCAHYSAIGCDLWKTKCMKCPQKMNYPQSIFLSKASDNYQKKKILFTLPEKMTLITPSNWLAEQTRESFLRKYPVRVIPNGVDLNRFRPIENKLRKQYNIETEKIILGVASVWDERKGLKDFIKLNNILDKPYKIVLIGITKKQKGKIPKDILCIERTSNISELAQWYTVADVFVNPSVEETMGLTTVEALACGTPVITYNQTAVPEVVDSTCGMVVECRPELIAEVVGSVQYDSSACRLRAENYEKNQQYMKYIHLYIEK